MRTKFRPENVKVRDHPEDLGVDGRIILERILTKKDGKVLNGCISFRIGTSGGIL
jgi:hypothetical protein